MSALTTSGLLSAMFLTLWDGFSPLCKSRLTNGAIIPCPLSLWFCSWFELLIRRPYELFRWKKLIRFTLFVNQCIGVEYDVSLEFKELLSETSLLWPTVDDCPRSSRAGPLRWECPKDSYVGRVTAKSPSCCMRWAIKLINNSAPVDPYYLTKGLKWHIKDYSGPLFYNNS